MAQSAKAEIQKLRAEIEAHNRRYYQESAATISDEAFDALLRRLRDLEAKHPEFADPNSPTQRVGGAPAAEFRTVTHRTPMLSMDNTYNVGELRDFHNRVVKLLDGAQPAYVAEPKIDGVSMSLVYERGEFVLGATRGDGRQGDDITANLRTIKSLPLRLAAGAPRFVEVRGEVFFNRAGFARFNQARAAQGEPEFANPRNAASGTLKMLDPRLVAKRPLRLLAYGIGACEGAHVASHRQSLQLLEAWGLPVSKDIRVFDDIEALVEYIAKWGEQRKQIEFDVDGMVIKVDDYRQRERLGATSKFPRWQVAYKYAAEQAVTRLEHIEIQVGRTGKLTPVAHLEPVLLAGTTVSRATLHNDEEIRRKDIRVGDLVVIAKAGEIIPQVLEVKTDLRTGKEKVFEFPKTCPACGGAVKRDEGGVYIRCVNPLCTAQLKELLEAFAHRQAMDIDGLGPAIVEQLVEAGLVKSLADLYRLNEADVAKLERMGKKSAANLIAAFAASKERGLTRLLVGLGIRHIGQRSATVLAQHFRSMEKLQQATAADLEKLPDIGPVVADSVARYFSDQGGNKVVEALAALGVRMTEPESVTAGKPAVQAFAGMSVAVTGKQVKYKREEIEHLIEAHGGKVASSISKKTNLLIAGEDAGSKLDKARELGIKVLSEAEFDALLQSPTT